VSGLIFVIAGRFTVKPECEPELIPGSAIIRIHEVVSPESM
jgi:hypothetical protein